MFPSNFVREIKKLVFCGAVIFCGTYTPVNNWATKWQLNFN
jgi:low affinity Fe/Cu permease